MNATGQCLPCETASLVAGPHDRCVGNGCRCVCRRVEPADVQAIVTAMRAEGEDPKVGPCRFGCGQRKTKGPGLASHERNCVKNPNRIKQPNGKQPRTEIVLPPPREEPMEPQQVRDPIPDTVGTHYAPIPQWMLDTINAVAFLDGKDGDVLVEEIVATWCRRRQEEPEVKQLIELLERRRLARSPL